MSIKEANANNYDELIKEGFVIVDLYGDDCNPCMMFSKVLDEMNSELDFVNIVKINVTQYQDMREKNNISGIPTILFMKDGKELDRNRGFMSLDELYI